MAQPVSILFALSASVEQVAALPERSILVTATESGWNDFGYKFRGSLYVVGEEWLELDHLLMFEGRKDTFAFLREHLAEGAISPLAGFGVRFCSLFQNPKSYSDLSRMVGVDAALDALSALGDAALLRDRVSDERFDLLSSEQFHLGMIRDPSAYRSFRKGMRVLTAASREKADDSAFSFKVTSFLPPTWKEVTAKFDFDADQFVRERIAVLVGPNGTGKTSLLVSMLKCLAYGVEQETQDDGAIATIEPRPRCNSLIVFSSAPSDKYASIRPTLHGADYNHFLLIEPASNMFDPLTLALIDILRDSESELSFPSLANLPVLAPVTSPKAILREVLTTLKLWDQVYLPVHSKKSTMVRTRLVGDVEYMGLSEFSSGEQRRLFATMSVDITKRPIHMSVFGTRGLSSGELAMFRFAVQLISTIEQGSIIILDEPETHLHPQYISIMIEVLDRVLKASGSCAIIASHSPFVVREVPSRRVLVLSKQDGETVALRPRLQTFGASIDAIADAVFSDSQRDHLHERLLDHWLSTSDAQRLDIEEIVNRYGGDLNRETLSYLARRMVERRN